MSWPGQREGWDLDPLNPGTWSGPQYKGIKLPVPRREKAGALSSEDLRDTWAHTRQAAGHEQTVGSHCLWTPICNWGCSSAVCPRPVLGMKMMVNGSGAVVICEQQAPPGSELPDFLVAGGAGAVTLGCRTSRPTFCSGQQPWESEGLGERGRAWLQTRLRSASCQPRSLPCSMPLAADSSTARCPPPPRPF